MDFESVPFGRRTLNSCLEAYIKHEPRRAFAYIPVSESIDDGFNNMTYAQLAKAVSITAHWLDQQLGKVLQTPQSREVISYMGPNDIRYFLLMLAADRTNRSVCSPVRPRACRKLIISQASGHCPRECTDSTVEITRCMQSSRCIVCQRP